MKLNNPSVMLISVCVLIAFIYYILHYIGYFTSQRIQDIKDYVQEAKKFKGYTKLDDDIEVYDENIIEILTENRKADNKNQHIILYGASGSGKTYFIKKYIERNKNYIVFCKDKEEWRDNNSRIYGVDKIDMLKNIEQFENMIIVLDDLGNNIIQKTLSEISSYGRHLNIQIIVSAHKAKDIDNKTRDNIYKVFMTVDNPKVFFEEIKDTYKIKHDLCKYVDLEHGIILLETNRNTLKVYNKSFDLHFDSRINNKTPTMKLSDLKKLYNLDLIENTIIREEIKFLLEKASGETINIREETLMFYLNIYFKQVGLKPKYAKLKRIVSESIGNNKTVFTLVKEAYSSDVKPLIREGIELKNELNKMY